MDFTRQNTGKDAKISRRRACGFDYLTARQKKVIRTRFEDRNFVQYFGKNPHNIRILSQILTSSYAKFHILKIRRTLKPEF